MTTSTAILCAGDDALAAHVERQLRVRLPGAWEGAADLRENEKYEALATELIHRESESLIARFGRMTDAEAENWPDDRVLAHCTDAIVRRGWEEDVLISRRRAAVVAAEIVRVIGDPNELMKREIWSGW